MYDNYRSLAQRLMKSQPVGTVTRKSSEYINPDKTFLGKTEDVYTFTAPMFRDNITVNERGLFDKLLFNKGMIESASCIMLVPNDGIASVDGITKFKINDTFVFGESEFLVKSLKEINPANESTPILTYLLCEDV